MGGLFTVGLHSNNLITCGEIFNILRPSLQIVFIFMQMHFVFRLPMSVFRRKLVTRLGLSHLLVSNVSLWLRALITETVEASYSGHIGDRLARDTDNLTRSEVNMTGQAEVGEAVEDDVICDGTVIFSLSRLTSPYLYPCLVQYSLICLAVVAAMWSSVATEHRRQRRSRGQTLYSSSCHRYSVDCNGSHAGLFCGVIMVVITIVSVILTFVFSNVSHNQLELSELVRSLSDLALYSIALVAVLLGTCQIRSVYSSLSSLTSLTSLSSLTSLTSLTTS